MLLLVTLTYCTEAIAQTWRTSFAIIRNFSKLMRPSTLESLPRWMKVKSFFTTGKNGICNRWLQYQHIIDSHIKSLASKFKPFQFDWPVYLHWLLDLPILRICLKIHIKKRDYPTKSGTNLETFFRGTQCIKTGTLMCETRTAITTKCLPLCDGLPVELVPSHCWRDCDSWTCFSMDPSDPVCPAT